jgi:hypothetical protein
MGSEKSPDIGLGASFCPHLFDHLSLDGSFSASFAVLRLMAPAKAGGRKEAKKAKEASEDAAYRRSGYSRCCETGFALAAFAPLCG